MPEFQNPPHPSQRLRTAGGRFSGVFVMQSSEAVQLSDHTLRAFEEYIRTAELAMAENLGGGGPFLWSDATSDRAQKVRRGEIVAGFWSGQGPLKISDGLIHDWVG